MPYFFNSCFLTCLSLLIISMHTGTVLAASSTVPVYELAISFNTTQKRLTGTAKIAIPAEEGISISLSGLQVTGAFIQSENGTEHILHPDEDTIEFEKQAYARTVYISYDKEITQNYTNLISPQGISLTANWYPYPSQPFIFQLSAHLPKGFSAITESDTFPLPIKKGITKSSWSRPTQSISFVAGPYNIGKQKVRDSLYVYSMFFNEDQSLVSGYLKAAVDYIKKYEKEIAPFPYNHYVIVANRLPTGYGMPSFTLIGQMVLRLPFIKTSSLGHEIVHSWFGNDVEVDYEQGNWCEGLTSFLADHAYRAEEGKGVEDRKSSLGKYHSYIYDNTENSITLNSFRSASHNQPMADAKRAVGYNGGAFLFHELREHLGTDVFNAGIRDFYLKKSGQPASWTDIQTSFETVSSQNLQSFFQTRLSMTNPPAIAATNISINTRAHIQLNFTLSQNAKEVLPLKVPIEVTTISGTYHFIEELDVANKDVSLTLPDIPLSFTLDPEYTLLRQLTPEEKSPLWSQFLGGEKKLIVLASEKDREQYKPILDSLNKYQPTIVTAETVTNQALSENNLLFLGADQLACRSLFGQVNHDSGSLTVDVRKNPLQSDLVAVIFSDKRIDKNPSIARRLSHYGKYSYIEFKADRSVEKHIKESTNGINYELERLPTGGATNALSDFDQIIDKLLSNRVIYLGETHNSLPDHILQLRIIEALYKKDPRLAIGMEMFPTSSQKSLDEFTREGSSMDETTFLKESDYFNVWRYDYRLFRDTLNFAKVKNLNVVGLNLDRQIVSDVFRAGNTDVLSNEIQADLVADRNLDLPGYQERLSIVHNAHISGKHANGASSGFIQSQALWDETMANNIVSFLQKHPDHRMVVIAGNQHTRKDSGIPPRVFARLPVVQASVINIYEDATPEDIQQTSDYFFLADNIELPQSPKIGLVLSQTPEKSDIEGLVIDELSPHGQAGAAGLLVGDIITRLDNARIIDMPDLRIAMIDAKAGETIEVEVRRGKEHPKNHVFKVELTIPQMPMGHP